MTRDVSKPPPAAAEYPPSKHLLRDLRIRVDRADAVLKARLDATPEIADGGGRTRVGVLATLVDVIAGETALRAVLPRWTATSDLTLHLAELPARGPIEATAQILRSGRQTVVLEAALRGDDGSGLGMGRVGFAVLPARDPLQSGGHWAEAPATDTDFSTPESGFRRPILEEMGIEFDAETPGVARLAGVPSRLVNSLGALQGGAVAILVEAAAERFAISRLGPRVRVRSLSIHYLKLARVGPMRAAPREVARTAGGLWVDVRLFDDGAANALVAAATIQVDEAPSVA